MKSFACIICLFLEKFGGRWGGVILFQALDHISAELSAQITNYSIQQGWFKSVRNGETFHL